MSLDKIKVLNELVEEDHKYRDSKLEQYFFSLENREISYKSVIEAVNYFTKDSNSIVYFEYIYDKYQVTRHEKDNLVRRNLTAFINTYRNERNNVLEIGIFTLELLIGVITAILATMTIFGEVLFLEVLIIGIVIFCLNLYFNRVNLRVQGNFLFEQLFVILEEEPLEKRSEQYNKPESVTTSVQIRSTGRDTRKDSDS